MLFEGRAVERLKRPVSDYRRIVNQDVDASKRPQGGIDDPSWRGRVAHVRGDRQSPASELLPYKLERLAASAHEHDVGPLPGEEKGRCRPESRPTTGYDRDTAHRFSLTVARPCLRRYRIEQGIGPSGAS